MSRNALRARFEFLALAECCIGRDSISGWRLSRSCVKLFQIANTGSSDTAPSKSRLKKLAHSLGIESSVTFLDQISRREVLATIAECDVMLHPTLHDSSGWASVEAMACGRPVVCLDLAGPALQVDADNGCKVPAVTPEQAIRDLAEALQMLASDRDKRLRMGRAARAKVTAELNWPRKAEQIRAIYMRLTAARQPSLAASAAHVQKRVAQTELVSNKS